MAKLKKWWQWDRNHQRECTKSFMLHLQDRLDQYGEADVDFRFTSIALNGDKPYLKLSFAHVKPFDVGIQVSRVKANVYINPAILVLEGTEFSDVASAFFFEVMNLPGQHESGIEKVVLHD